MEDFSEGATIWARKTLDSNIFYNKPAEWFKIWFYIVSKVNHKDNKQFKRGQCLLKYEWIEEKCSVSKNQVDHFIRWAKSATQIATQKTTQGFIITVLNYNKYQDFNTYKSDKKSDAESEMKAKQKRNESDTINNNDNNVKNDNKRETSIQFLLNIPMELQEELSYKYICSISQVVSKGEDLYNYCKAKGKIYRDYKAFLLNAVKRDFGVRKEAKAIGYREVLDRDGKVTSYEKL